MSGKSCPVLVRLKEDLTFVLRGCMEMNGENKTNRKDEEVLTRVSINENALRKGMNTIDCS